MSAPTSFGDFFSSSGRLRRQWQTALQDPDPHSGLTKLRRIWAQWERRPEAVAPFYVDFVRSVTGPPYRPLLTEDDFGALEALSGRVAGAGDGVPLDEAVRPLAAARFGRGEETPACDLLTRLYWTESLRDTARASVADELARSGPRDAPRIEVCADLLGRSGPRPPAVLALAAEVLRVDFSSDAERLRQASSLAATGLPGADRAAGLHALRVTGELDAARAHFLAARIADPHDTIALLGLLLSCIRAGLAAEVPGWAFDAAEQADAGVGGQASGGQELAAPGLAATARLGRVLAWFDEDSDRPPPVPAARLAAPPPSHQVGPWLDYARGRLRLLEGDAARARDLLVPLTRGESPAAAWRYHAAWSLYLTGDRAGLRLLIERMTGDPDDWALARLLLDTEPHALTGTAAEHAAAAVPPGYERVGRVRRDLAEGRRRPDPPDRGEAVLPAEGRGAPRRLEALRTVLGAAYGRATGAAEMAALLTEPLYRRLPRADRLLWSGLLALRRNPEEGRRLLEEARSLGHGRAVLVLAAHHLEELRPARAGRLLAGLGGEKAELLRVWAEAVGGAADGVVEEGLGRLTAHRLPQVPYALGALRLHRFAGEGGTEDPEDAPYHARRAARELGRALATAPDAVPADAAVLERAARTVAHATAVASGDGPAVLSPSVRQHPWAEWVLGLALLAEDPETADPELCRRLVALLEESDDPPPEAVTVLATALTAASMRGTTPYRRDALAHLVRTLAGRHPLPELHTLADRAGAAALAHSPTGHPPAPAGQRPDGTGRFDDTARFDETGPSGTVRPTDEARPTDEGRLSDERSPAEGAVPRQRTRPGTQPVLALASAVGELTRGDRAAAVRELRAAPADGELCGVLADALEGRPPSAPPPVGAGERAALFRVVHAAGLVESDPLRSLELLSAAAPHYDLSTVTDLAHLLPALFAHAAESGAAGGRAGGARGGAAGGRGAGGPSGRRKGGGARGRGRGGDGQGLLEWVKGLAGAEPAPVGAGVLGNCAAALGDFATAAELWERALREAEREGRDDGEVRTRYVLSLCHLAVAAHRAGELLRGAGFLHRAAAVLRPAGPTTRRLPSRGRIEALARGLELDTCVHRLLDRVFPGAEGEPVPWERPGRYAALEASVRADPELTDALRTAESPRVERCWADGLRTWAYDVRLHHTLALLHRGTALGGPADAVHGGGHLARATVLWTLLLASERFWEQHGEEPAAPEEETLLRTTVCRELFALHRRLGAEALRAGERDTARLHLRVLVAVRMDESEVRGLLGEFGFGWSVTVDARRWAEISALAGAVTDEWCAEAVLTAEKALNDPVAIEGLAEGIDKDYESGIDALRPLTGLGVPLPRLLRTALDWHNSLQHCLYQMKRTAELRKVIGRAREFADGLAPFCTPGKGHLPGNRALCIHYKYLGLFVAADSASASHMYRQALRWDPGDDNAAELLEQGAYTSWPPGGDVDEGSDRPGRARRAKRKPGGTRRDSRDRRDRSPMKPNPFHVLGLSLSADDEEVAERFRELSLTGAHEAGALAEWAKDELMGPPGKRRLHALLEAPGADYRGERWEDFAKQYGRRPVVFASRPDPAGAPRAADFDLTAVARRLLDGMLTPPEVDIRPALDRPPVPLYLERPRWRHAMSSSADTAPGTAPADPPPADPTPADPTPVGSTPVGSTPVGWDEFEPRPVPEGAEAADPVSPGREMAVLLQRYWSDLQDEGNRVRKETAAARQVLIELAVHVARLEQLARAAAGPLEAAGDRSLGRRLAVAGKQVREPLHTAGITTRDPVGEPYESVADVVDIAGWRYGPEFTAEVVAETVEPIVLDRGTVVRLGQVIMGAPSGAPADEAGDTEDTVAAADAAQDAGDDV